MWFFNFNYIEISNPIFGILIKSALYIYIIFNLLYGFLNII